MNNFTYFILSDLNKNNCFLPQNIQSLLRIGIYLSIFAVNKAIFYYNKLTSLNQIRLYQYFSIIVKILSMNKFIEHSFIEHL